MSKFFTIAVVAVLSLASVQFAAAARPEATRGVGRPTANDSGRPAANTCTHHSHNDNYSEELGLEVKETRIGLEVVEVDRRSAAEDADLREGDLILEVNGRKPRDLQHLLDLAEGNGPAVLLVEDEDGDEFELELEVATSQDVFEIEELGVEVEELENGTLKVLSVERRSLAADLDVQVDDVIVKMNGLDVTRIRDLEDEISDRMTLTVKANGNSREIDLEL